MSLLKSMMIICLSSGALSEMLGKMFGDLAEKQWHIASSTNWNKN